MAAIGDWIKMRSCLLNHPKVIGMVNYLIKEDDFFIFVCGAHTFANREEGYTVTDYVTKTTLRYVTVSALLSLWSSARLHSDNGILYGLKLSDLDDMAGVPCFGKALESVGWASVCNDTQAVILSNFTEWNEQVHRGPVKSNAERQKEWRSRQKNTVTKRNESNDREEKRREEYLIGDSGEVKITIQDIQESSEAAQLAQEFHFRIPGTSKPILSDLVAEFQAKLDWLKATGRNETEHIRKCIVDPKRDKSAAKTIGTMFKFWQFCGLEEKKHEQRRDNHRRGSPMSAGGGRYEGIKPRIVKL